jgi:hypothetical protein
MIPAIITPPTVTELASGVLNVARKASTPPNWPNLQESLVELYVILNEWCDAAAASNEKIEALISVHRTGDPGVQLGGTAYDFGSQTVRLVGNAVADSQRILRPAAPWLQKWSSSKRRTAARRNLGSILTVYAPELIKMFDEAVSSRETWVKWREEELKRWLQNEHSVDEEDQLRGEMRTSLNGLERARDELEAFLNKNYPLGIAEPGSP